MTPVRSIALATDLALAAMRGSVEDRGDYLVVRTPDDPGYYYGNLLVLPAAPQVGEVAFWTRRFGEAFAGEPRVRHVTFVWDGTAGDVGAADELRAAGFTLDETETMTARALAAPAGAALPIRALAPDEVIATADLAWRIGDRHDERFREFLRARARWHAGLVARGVARFVGAHDGDALVASCGLVLLDARARYQDVQTAEAYRGRGCAGALLAAAATHAPDHELVIVAQTPRAARVYARVGFHTVEHTASACRSPTDPA